MDEKVKESVLALLDAAGGRVESTWGDVAYSANMHYADYFGTTLKTEADCVKQARRQIPDNVIGIRTAIVMLSIRIVRACKAGFH